MRYVIKALTLNDITPSFITICVNWISRHTYGVYLVLSLKPGATGTFPNHQTTSWFGWFWFELFLHFHWSWELIFRILGSFRCCARFFTVVCVPLCSLVITKNIRPPFGSRAPRLWVLMVLEGCLGHWPFRKKFWLASVHHSFGRLSQSFIYIGGWPAVLEEQGTSADWIKKIQTPLVHPMKT